MVEQLPALLGLTMEHHHGDMSTFGKAKAVGEALSTAHGLTVAVGLGSFLFLVGFKFLKKYQGHRFPWLKQIPEILCLVVINLLLSWACDFKGVGIKTLGTFDNQLAKPSFPLFSFELVNRLMSDVITITIVGFIECQTVTRNYGLKHGYFPSGNQELFALGMSNIIGSTLGAYVTFGSLPRSRIQATVGGKTTVTGIIAAIIVLLAFTFCAEILKYLPRAALAAIVFNAAVNLIEYHEIIYLFKMRIWYDIGLFIITFAITFFLTMGDGVLLCILLAVLIILRRSTSVDLSLLGCLPDYMSTHKFVDMKEFPEAEVVDGVLIMGLRGSLRFYNAGQLRRTMEHLMDTETKLYQEERRIFNGDMIKTVSQTTSATKRYSDDMDPFDVVFGDDNDEEISPDAFCVILDFMNCTDVVCVSSYFES